MLALLVSNWKLIGKALVALAVASALAYAGHRMLLVDELEAKLSTAETVNQSNVLELNKIKAENKAALAAVAKAHAVQVKQEAKLNAIRKEAKDEKDGAVAPVLRTVLDGLRK